MYKSIAAKINIAAASIAVASIPAASIPAASIAAVSGITISNCCCKYGTAHVQVYKQTRVTHCASRNLEHTRVLGSCDTRNTLPASDYL